MKCSTLRTWIKMQIQGLTPVDRAYKKFKYEHVDMRKKARNAAECDDRLFDITWGPAPLNWKDGLKTAHRRAFYQEATILVLYYGPENMDDATEDRAMDDAKQIAKTLQDPTNRLAQSDEGSHVRTEVEPNGFDWIGRILVTQLGVRITHRRSWS